MKGLLKPHFIAAITLRTPDQRGRKSGVDLGQYRPDIRFPFESKYVYGAHFEPDAGRIEPGETKEVEVQIRSAASMFMSQVSEGTSFVLVEGPFPVADGVVTGVYRRDD